MALGCLRRAAPPANDAVVETLEQTHVAGGTEREHFGKARQRMIRLGIAVPVAPGIRRAEGAAHIVLLLPDAQFAELHADAIAAQAGDFDREDVLDALRGQSDAQLIAAIDLQR